MLRSLRELSAMSIAFLAAAFVVGLGIPASATSEKCPSRPFVGAIERSDDTRTNQPELRLKTRDVERALAFDFGSARNTTIYLATYKLAPKDLGTTVEAPHGETLVTVFLRAKSGDLAPGKRLKAPGDTITAIIDGGGGARATTSGATATARVIDFDDGEVCAALDYRDDFQRVKGLFRAKFP